LRQIPGKYRNIREPTLLYLRENILVSKRTENMRRETVLGRSGEFPSFI